MTYYYLENKIDAKETGNVFPQVNCESIHLAHQIQFDEFAYFDSELLFNLQPKAKLTNVLSQAAISARGLLIDRSVRELFDTFNLMNYRLYKCLIKNRKEDINHYSWLHLVDQSLLHKIDYLKSNFYLKEGGFREGDIYLTSFDDYLRKKDELGNSCTIHSDKIVLGNDFNIEMDLFTIPIFDKRIYISEGLKNAIEQSNLTGIKVAEASNITLSS